MSASPNVWDRLDRAMRDLRESVAESEAAESDYWPPARPKLTLIEQAPHRDLDERERLLSSPIPDENDEGERADVVDMLDWLRRKVEAHRA